MPEAQEPFEDLIARASEVATRAALREMTHEGQICTMCYVDLTPEEIDDPDATYREVASWVTGPKLQSPVLRAQTGRIAHKTCIEKLLNGQSPDQEPLPGLEL